MKLRLITIILALLPTSILLAQHKISGTAVDATGSPVAGTTIRLTGGVNGKTFNQATTAHGTFSVTVNDGEVYHLSISHIGFDKFEKDVRITANNLDLGILTLRAASTELNIVTIVRKKSPVKQKADTTEFSASAYKTNPDASVEDLMRKMPGVTSESGTLKAQGEEVKKVTIDGRDYFGDDASAALKNLPAELVDKIQVFDRMSEQSQLTGFDDGNSVKAINIVTRADMKNGRYGRLTAGYGTADRYSAGGNMSIMGTKQRVSILGLSNNINQQNFASQDLIGISQSGGKKSKAAKGTDNAALGKNASNFAVGPQKGINATTAGGINYSFTPSKSLEVTASYLANQTRSNSEEVTNRATFLGNDSTLNYAESAKNYGINTNHRFNVRADYKLDSATSLIYSGKNSFQHNRSQSFLSGENGFGKGAILNQVKSSSSSNKTGTNLDNEIMIKHQFAKRGRSIVAGISQQTNSSQGSLTNMMSIADSVGMQMNSTEQLVNQRKWNNEAGAEINYSEPVGKNSIIMIGFNPELERSEISRIVYTPEKNYSKVQVIDSNLSSVFSANVFSQKTSLGFKTGAKDNMFSAEVKFRTATLNGVNEAKGTQVVRTFSNVLPDLNWKYRISARSSLKAELHSSVELPAADKLQEVINNSDLLFLSTGNSNLSQQVSRKLSARYTFINPVNGSALFANISLQTARNYITTGSFLAYSDSSLDNGTRLAKGAQLTKPVNLDGYKAVRSLITYSFVLRPLKSSLSLTANYASAKTPALLNGMLNFNSTESFGSSASLASNISTGVDFTLSYTINNNQTVNSLRPERLNRYLSQFAVGKINLLSKSGWLLQSDISYQSFTGLSKGYDQRYCIWNLAAGKKMLKNQAGELKLSASDLLRQNRSISRLVTETYIEDMRNTVLQQYVMLSFTYRFRAFQAGR